MDALLLASITFLTTVFSLIGIAVLKLWLDERSSRERRETQIAIGLVDDNGTVLTPNSDMQMDESEDDELRGNEDSDEDISNQGMKHSEKKIGKKKLAKLQAKAEAKAIRQQEQVEREEKKKREEEIRKQEEKKREVEEEEQRKQAEKRRLEREEKERRELEEYLKLKNSFEVQEQGYDYDMTEDNGESMLESFVAFVRKRKVVHVDELASVFKSKPMEMVNRLKQMLQETRLTGLFDDRGLFIYITEEELLSVAKFINQRGRVHLAEIVEHSKNLISLEPSMF